MPTKMKIAEAAVLKAREADDKFQNAREQAQAQFESIREMVEALEAADLAAIKNGPTADGNFDEACEAARQAIQEDALSVEVRTAWYSPSGAFPPDRTPSEYRILLCTGGPAVQITGELNEHGEPETARLEMQDWFVPWTPYRPTWFLPENPNVIALEDDTTAILLIYARQFYFGE